MLRPARVRSTWVCYQISLLDQNSRFYGPAKYYRTIVWSISQNCRKWQFQNRRSHQVHPVQYILSVWKVVQMTQPEFVDSQVYFDPLVLKYLS